MPSESPTPPVTVTSAAPGHHGADDLAAFLRTRRAAADPAALGIATYGARRVPGLRREELAEAAGVSLTYYTRLEQGLATNPSSQVLDALVRALRLSDVEGQYLRRLAGVPLTPNRDRRHLRVGIAPLLEAMSDVAALALSPYQDIVAWNRLGHALMAGHLDPAAPYGDDPPNKLRMLFTDDRARLLHREWEREASLAVASIRFVTGRFPDDPELNRLVGDLSVASRDFARLWAEHPVELCASGTKRYHHPELGRLDLQYEVLHLPEDDGHRLLLQYAVPGSTDEDSLRLLAARSVS